MGLLDRDPTPEDLEAERDRPRHGVWTGEPNADLRALTQEETDQLIRAELCMSAPPGELEEIQRACGLSTSTASDGRPTRPMFDVADGAPRIAWYQRGGIDSDPLVRVLARRAWGDRDRQWFELRGVRKGDAVAWVLELDLPAGFFGPSRAEYALLGEQTKPGMIMIPIVSPVIDDDEYERASQAQQAGGVGCAWPGQDHLGVALDAGRPGEQVRYAPPQKWLSDGVARVSDRLREPPQTLPDAGQGLPVDRSRDRTSP